MEIRRRYYSYSKNSRWLYKSWDEGGRMEGGNSFNGDGVV